MHKLLVSALVILGIALLAAPAGAQQIQLQATVIASCGTASYGAGTNRPWTMNTLGQLCLFGATSGTVTSISNSDSTLTLSPNPITGVGTISLNLNNANIWTANQAITATVNGTVSLAVTNNATGAGGTAASARLQAFNDAGNAIQILETGSGFTPSGNNLANQGQLVSGGPGGLYINSGNASGPLTLAANGTAGLTLTPNTGAVTIGVSLDTPYVNVTGSACPVTGIDRPAANQVGVCVNSLQVALFTSTGLNNTVIGATTAAALSATTGAFSGSITVTSGGFVQTGNRPAANINTAAGVKLTQVASTINDTADSGTVATGYLSAWLAQTVTATSATTFTNLYGSYFVAPVCSTNVTCTNGPWALGADSLRIVGGQLNISAMTQTSVAQSGTVCYNSGTGAVTYDATLGCLASLPELKDIRGPISNTLAVLDQIKPIWFSWKHSTPEWKGGDHDVQAGLNAREIAAIPLLGKNLTARDEGGNLRGVRYMEMAAFNLAVEKDLKALVLKQDSELRDLRVANDNLTRRVAALEHRR